MQAHASSPLGYMTIYFLINGKHSRQNRPKVALFKRKNRKPFILYKYTAPEVLINVTSLTVVPLYCWNIADVVLSDNDLSIPQVYRGCETHKPLTNHLCRSDSLIRMANRTCSGWQLGQLRGSPLAGHWPSAGSWEHFLGQVEHHNLARSCNGTGRSSLAHHSERKMGNFTYNRQNIEIGKHKTATTLCFLFIHCLHILLLQYAYKGVLGTHTMGKPRSCLPQNAFIILSEMTEPMVNKKKILKKKFLTSKEFYLKFIIGSLHSETFTINSMLKYV